MGLNKNEKWTKRDAICAGLGIATSIVSGPNLAFAGENNRVWRKLNTVPYRGKQDDIYFINPNIGWYGNGQGKLYQTIDGGENWVLKHEKAGTFIRALGFIDERTGFIGNIGTDYYPNVSDTNPLYKTSDGGQSWTPIIAPNIGVVKGICGIHILHRKTIFQGELINRPIIHAAGRVGSPAALMRSIDGGENWTVRDMTPWAAMIFDVYFMDENIGFVCSSTDKDVDKGFAQILRTADGGQTWRAVYRGARPFENCWKMHFPTNRIGYASVQTYNENAPQQRIIKSTNGGRSWREINLIDSKEHREFGIGFIDENIGWVGTRQSGMETLDSGRTWRANNLGPAINKIRIVRADGITRAFAIGVDVWRLDL